PHTDDQWRALTQHTVRKRGDRYVLHYDPAIAQTLAAQQQAANQEAGAQVMWRCFTDLQCEVTVLRGEQSDILGSATVERMRELQPSLTVHEFAGVGHAPSLLQDDQISRVREA